METCILLYPRLKIPISAILYLGLCAALCPSLRLPAPSLPSQLHPSCQACSTGSPPAPEGKVRRRTQRGSWERARGGEHLVDPERERGLPVAAGRRRVIASFSSRASCSQLILQARRLHQSGENPLADSIMQEV